MAGLFLRGCTIGSIQTLASFISPSEPVAVVETQLLIL